VTPPELLATAKGWLTRGRRGQGGEYTEFVEAMDDARAAARARPEPMDADELARVVVLVRLGGCFWSRRVQRND
jgi:hypothetical protein